MFALYERYNLLIKWSKVVANMILKILVGNIWGLS